jgi:nicotinate-nucleotide adenylyltransferase
MTPRRIGILGGTLDPVHTGHLEAAAVARDALSLDVVQLMPSMTPPHRQLHPHASPFHRFAMVALAVAERPGLLASDDELCGEGPSFTSDTLARWHARGFAPTELFFVLGSDAFADIAAWHHYPEVLDAAHFVVVARPGTSLADLRAHLPALDSRMSHDVSSITNPSRGTPGIVLLSASTPNVSSTEIRRRVGAGEPLDGLTPRVVIAHIERHQLYKEHRQ